MEIILKEDIKGLGYKNDIVKVKGGYARNYLIPQGMGIVANKSNRKIAEENLRQAAHKLEKLKKDAEEVAKKVGDLTLEIKAKVGEKDKIFGTITNQQIVDALHEKGFDSIDRKHVNFRTKVKTLGEYSVTLELHKEVKHPITLKVIPDKESKA